MAGRKVNADVIVNVRKWVEGGAKDKIIANAFNFSVATVQNIKRTGFDYKMYRKLVNRQLTNWSSKYGSVKSSEASKVSAITYLDAIVKKLDELTERFDTIFPKVKQRGKKTNERNNSNI